MQRFLKALRQRLLLQVAERGNDLRQLLIQPLAIGAGLHVSFYLPGFLCIQQMIQVWIDLLFKFVTGQVPALPLLPF